MNFNYTRQNINGLEKRLERLFEIMPGLSSWTILAGMLYLSFHAPVTAAVIIIAFDLYWLFKIFYMNIFLTVSYMRLSIEKNTDWFLRAGDLDDPMCRREQNVVGEKFNLKRMLSRYIYEKEIRDYIVSDGKKLRSGEIYNLVIIPVASEKKEIVEPGIKSIVNGKFPSGRVIAVIALEERASENVKKDMYEIRDVHKEHFYDFLVTVHPDGIPGEAKVKGANATYAARKAAEYLTAKGIAYENVIVSCFDADTVISPDYFSCLTYRYMLSMNRDRASFQPIPVYHNNIWDVPNFARVLDVGASFYQLIQATNPEKLVTFSSHSMSFKALVEVGYWPVDMISDDSAIYWKSFIHFDGDYQVIPMYVTVSMDVTQDKTWWKTAVNVYKQKRRWAWGVENFPIVARAFLKAASIPVHIRIKQLFKLFEGQVSWVVWPFLLTIISWFPATFARNKLAGSIFYYSTPRITQIIFGLASLGFLICIVLSLLLLPRHKVKYNFLRRLTHVLEWLLIPVASVVFSALPALDAQTRLMTAKYMEFWVTVKTRK
ncbi:MAG TPA: glycosyltransferase family 2 protein [Candidatus Omnitrophota bacterium]|nr:glycosyltransferase family 2 protein [Candidatus Omnitrophota bacterium]HPS20108.1 glycosyltransferase family 2 protein [Candidatus Omnitrophota bacterium]